MQHQLWQPRYLQGHLTQLTKCGSTAWHSLAKWLVLKRSQDVPGQCMSMCQSHKSNATSIAAHHVAVTVTVSHLQSSSFKMLQEITRISKSDWQSKSKANISYQFLSSRNVVSFRSRYPPHPVTLSLTCPPPHKAAILTPLSKPVPCPGLVEQVRTSLYIWCTYVCIYYVYIILHYITLHYIILNCIVLY